MFILQKISTVLVHMHASHSPVSAAPAVVVEVDREVVRTVGHLHLLHLGQDTGQGADGLDDAKGARRPVVQAHLVRPVRHLHLPVVVTVRHGAGLQLLLHVVAAMILENSHKTEHKIDCVKFRPPSTFANVIR